MVPLQQLSRGRDRPYDDHRIAMSVAPWFPCQRDPDHHPGLRLQNVPLFLRYAKGALGKGQVQGR